MIGRLLSLLGLTVADFLILLGFVAIIGALFLPTMRDGDTRSELDAMLADVATLRGAAIDYRQTSGAWPEHAQPGEIPPGLFGSFPGDTALVRESYTVQWASFEVVDFELPAAGPADPEAPPEADAPDEVEVPSVPVVRRMGGIIVHSTDARVLSELATAYGPEASFVRDDAWTLVLPERSEAR